jgi:hypothetical protein
MIDYWTMKYRKILEFEVEGLVELPLQFMMHFWTGLDAKWLAE